MPTGGGKMNLEQAAIANGFADPLPRQKSPVRPVLKYFGAKFLLRDWIISQFPAHEIYCEPFGGSAAILLNKPRARIEYYNDLDGEVTNFFLVLRDQLPAFLRLLKRTPYSRETFQDAAASMPDVDHPVRRAWAFHVRSWQGIGGNRGRGWRAHGNIPNGMTGTSGGHHPANLYADQVRRVVIASKRLRGVHIENRPAIDVCRMVDSPDTLHYLDPPYLGETRGASIYKHELMDSADLFGGGHSGLLDAIQSLRGAVILSGYASELYDTALPGWRRIEKATRDNLRRERIECLWLNPKAQEKNL